MTPTALATSFQTRERLPLIPSRGPALLMSWQENPAETMSTRPTSLVQSKVVMSPTFGTSGQW